MNGKYTELAHKPKRLWTDTCSEQGNSRSLSRYNHYSGFL